MADIFRKDHLGPEALDEAATHRATLSICMRCRDGREDDEGDVRGGARLAAAVMRDGAVADHIEIRGVHCMSQCKRPCVIALSGPDRFTYFFGDLDPSRDADAIAKLAELYRSSPDGFMSRDERPAPMQAGVIGRLPPLGWAGETVEITNLTNTTNWETPQ